MTEVLEVLEVAMVLTCSYAVISVFSQHVTAIGTSAGGKTSYFLICTGMRGASREGCG